MMSRVTKKRRGKERFGKMVEAIEADGPLEATVLASSLPVFMWPTDLDGELAYNDRDIALSHFAKMGPEWSLWGFYYWETTLYRFSIAKPRDSRWVLLRAGTK